MTSLDRMCALMRVEQLIALTTSGESEALEFKKTTGTRREATMTVCAFLNQRTSGHKRTKHNDGL